MRKLNQFLSSPTIVMSFAKIKSQILLIDVEISAECSPIMWQKKINIKMKKSFLFRLINDLHNRISMT